MLKKSSFIIVFTLFIGVFMLFLWCSNSATAVYGQSRSLSNEKIMINYKQLSTKQLFDTANYYVIQDKIDTALIYYKLFINTATVHPDAEMQKRLINAHNSSAFIYYYLCDYRNSYKSLIEALLLCEKYNHEFYKSTIYTNIGNIYSHYQEYDMAKYYYSKSLSSSQDTLYRIPILNNLACIEMRRKQTANALYFLNEALQTSKRYNDFNLHSVLSNVAWFYQIEKQYDSAFYYYNLTLENIRKERIDRKNVKKDNKLEVESESLSNIGKLFFEVNKKDSALYYIGLSQAIALKNNFLTISVENYLTLSKIEEAKGHIRNAFECYKKYADLKDSAFNVKNLCEINQLQRLYEVSKTNQQIEQLAMEQRIKERTIHYQRIIQYITLGILLLVTMILVFIFIQKRKLNKAYQVLFEKNIEIMEFHANPPKKYEKSPLTDDLQQELLERILILMEDTSLTCDTEFSIERLATLSGSNQRYVSQVINNGLKKNFRSFLNNYRIREAQQLFSELDVTKYTIESIALQVGFKSPSAFRNAFKEITGVSPNFYLKALQESGKN